MTTRRRESSAPFSSNEGFSVVAPTSDDVSGLDEGQKRVLLRPVEAVDLVHEEERTAAPALGASRLLHHDSGSP